MTDAIHKSEKFYKLLASTNFAQLSSFTPKKFEYLFNIPDTKIFFDWLVTNVNEDCYLSASQLNEFIQRADKGQIIWDLNKLESLTSLIGKQDERLVNSGETKSDMDDSETIRRRIEFKEKQLEAMSKQYEIAQFTNSTLSEQMFNLKQKQEVNSKLIHSVSEKESKFKNVSRATSQSMSRLSSEFQIKFGDEDKLNSLLSSGIGCSSIESGDYSYESYLNTEKSLIEKIKSLAFVEIDCVDFKNSHENMTFSEFWQSGLFKDEKINFLLKLIAKKYPRVIQKWFGAKIEHEFSQGNMQLMMQMLEKRGEIFAYSQSELQASPQLKQLIEEEIRNNERAYNQINDECKQLTDKMAKQIYRLSSLKSINIINYHMIKKKIDLTFFQSKQERLIRALNAQKHRAEFLSYLFTLKYEYMDELRQLLEQLSIDSNVFLLPSSANMSTLNPSLNSTFLPNAKSNTSYCQPNMLLSSTIAPFKMSTSVPRNQLLNLSSIGDSSEITSTVGTNSAFVLSVNQFLISALKTLSSMVEESGNETLMSNSDSQPGQFQLKLPISTHLADNMDNLIDLSIKLVSNRPCQIDKVNKLCVAIEKAMDYLYEKETTKSGVKYNLNSETNVKMIKSLREPLWELTQKTNELENMVAGRILHKLRNYKTELTSNKYKSLKRDFFVAFYTDKSQVDSVIDELNSLDTSYYI